MDYGASGWQPNRTPDSNKTHNHIPAPGWLARFLAELRAHPLRLGLIFLLAAVAYDVSIAVTLDHQPIRMTIVRSGHPARIMAPVLPARVRPRHRQAPAVAEPGTTQSPESARYASPRPTHTAKPAAKRSHRPAPADSAPTQSVGTPSPGGPSATDGGLE